MNGLGSQKDNITVADLIGLLRQEPPDNPVYFGTYIADKVIATDEFGYESEYDYEFDDWLEFQNIEESWQGYREDGKTKTRKVTVIELKY